MMTVHQLIQKQAEPQEGTITMQEMVRKYQFTSTLTNVDGVTATLTADYNVKLRRNDVERFTYITIIPDFGPAIHARVSDVGITWKSLLHAWVRCAEHARKHLQAWVEMDLSAARTAKGVFVGGGQVIPDQKLSTGKQGDNNV